MPISPSISGLFLWQLVLVFSYAGISDSSFAQTHAQRETKRINALIMQANKEEKIDSAIHLLKLAIHRSAEIGYDFGIADGSIGLSNKYISVGKFEEAHLILDKALRYCKRTPEKKGLVGKYYNNKALAYYYSGLYSEAMAYYLKSLKEFERIGQSERASMALTYNNLGIIQLTLNQYQQAFEYFNKGENLARRKGYSYELALILINKGGIHSDNTEYKLAITCYQEALALGNRINNSQIQVGALISTGDLLNRNNSSLEAIVYLKKGIELSKRNSFYSYEIVGSYFLGSAYYKLKEYSKARLILEPALKQAKNLDIKENIVEGELTLANVYDVLGKKELAFQTILEAWDLRDSLLGTEKTEAVNNLELKYKTAEKDKQLAVGKWQLANQEKELAKKNLWIGGIAGGAVIISLVLGGYYRNTRSKQRLNEAKINGLQKEQELSQLRGIMKGEDKERSRIARELHDGIVGQLYAIKMNFNAVQTDHQLAQSEDFTKALQQLEDAAGDLRKTAHNLMPDVLLLGGLGEALQVYCQKMEHNYKLNLEFHLYGSLPRLDPDFELSVYRIIQELTTNIVKHAEADHVIIQLNYQEGLLILTVEDNGKGLSPTLTDSQKGMGLLNISSRVKAFNGQIELESSPGNGTTVHIEFEVGKLQFDPA
jgi:signal transduction histidine kinase